MRTWAFLLIGLTACVSRSGPPDVRDTQIAVQVRKAFLQDGSLSRYNVGVRVVNGSATLWGTVPTWELAERALQLAEKTPGVYFVKSELHVTGGYAEQVKEELIAGLKDEGVMPFDTFPPSPLDDDVGAFARLSGPPPEGSAEVVINAQPPRPPLETSGVSLLPPQPVTMPTSLPNYVPASRLREQIEALYGQDPRYQFLHINELEGHIVLTGWVERAEDLYALVQLIARVTGVKLVDPRAVRTESQ